MNNSAKDHLNSNELVSSFRFQPNFSAICLAQAIEGDGREIAVLIAGVFAIVLKLNFQGLSGRSS